MKTKVYFRADGNSEIGLGHLVRCSALAHMLKKHFLINFINKEIPESLKQEFINSGFGQTKIQKEEDFLNSITENDIVVLDHYGLNSNYQKSVKEIGAKLVCIDDLCNKEFFADLIINHSPGVKPEDYKAQSYTRFALGLEYALLRPAFLKAAKKKRVVTDLQNACICFGGADNLNLTKSTLKTALDSRLFKKIIVITGSAYTYSSSLKEFRKLKIVKFYQSIKEKAVADIFFQSDVAIVPSSGVLMEALATGCKVISGIYIDNQRALFREYNKLNLLISAADFSTENLKTALNKIHLAKGFIPFDGESGKRLLTYFKLIE